MRGCESFHAPISSAPWLSAGLLTTYPIYCGLIGREVVAPRDGEVVSKVVSTTDVSSKKQRRIMHCFYALKT